MSAEELLRSLGTVESDKSDDCEIVSKNHQKVQVTEFGPVVVKFNISNNSNEDWHPDSVITTDFEESVLLPNQFNLVLKSKHIAHLKMEFFIPVLLNEKTVRF